MAETSSWRQFLMLLYKGLLLRRRHYVVTFFELVIPVVISSIPAFLMSSEEVEFDKIDKTSLWVKATTFPAFDPFDTGAFKYYDLQFVYTPSNNVANMFMSDAIAKFRRNTLYKGNISTIAVNSESELEVYCIRKRKEDNEVILIGTIFNDFKTELPSSLDYKIRYSGSKGLNNFHTQMKYHADGPQQDSVYRRDTFFLSWQASVEQTFIQRKITEKGKNIDFKVHMQRFPYPEHRDTSKSFSVINIIPWTIGFGYLVFIINLLKRVIEEKANGSKELLKMMGMTNGMYWLSTFINYFIIAFVTTLIITIIYKSPVKDSIIFIKHMDFILLDILLLLFMSSLILFCLAFSIFFNRAVFGIIALIIIYLVSFTMLMTKYFALESDTNYMPLSVIKKVGICLFPPGNLLTTFSLISFYESIGEGVQWSNLTEFHLIPDLNMLMIIGSIFLSCLMYIILIWYFDAVWPWQYGVPKPFYFPFTRTYWCGEKSHEEDLQLMPNLNDSDMEFFEEEPSGASPGVIIRNLSKEFRTGLQTKMAVNNVSLNIYQGQITALLGHNGAGKTTTISILTGLITPSSGTATINGLDILTETAKARRGVGICPQHNVLYDTLTVDEHLRIYAAMKGVPWNRLNDESTAILESLKFADKRHELTKNLSGGMKRKLSLGIAIIGGSKVLFLDEPTSGMDIEARRSVWDALLDIRHNRTIILTTHYMEEADILGDRIAIMAQGEVQCCGSPMFLKQKFGTGYHLHVVKNQDFVPENLTALLEKHIPGAKKESELGKDISYNLAYSGNDDIGGPFGEMFEEVENRKAELGVISYGITITTMEDVFLNVSNLSDIKYNLSAKNDEKNGSSMELENILGGSKQQENHRDPGNQFIGLFLKRFHYAKRHWSILFSLYVIPFFLLCLCLYSINSASKKAYGKKPESLKLDISQVYGYTEGFYHSKDGQEINLTESIQNVLEINYVKTKNISDPTQYISNYGKADLAKYLKTLLVGGAVDKFPDGTLNLTAWYNGEPHHTLPMSLLLMHTALLKYITGGGSISLVNDPLYASTFVFAGEAIISFAKEMSSVFIPLGLAFLSASFVLLPIHERTSKAKLMQLMTGIPAIMYWCAMFLWDLLVYAALCILFIIPFAIFCPGVFFAPHSEAIGTTLLLFLLYGWASIPFSYFFSFIYKTSVTGFAAVTVLSILFGTGVISSFDAIIIAYKGYSIKEINSIVWGFRIIPCFSITVGFSNLFGIVYHNSMCDTIPVGDLEYNCKTSSISSSNPLYKCCKDICGENCLQEIDPITWDQNACGRDIIFLLFDGFFYFFVVLLLETRILALISLYVKNFIFKHRKSVIDQVRQENSAEDSEVLTEEERVRNIQESGLGLDNEALVVLDLTKTYRNFYAVDHLTFGIHEEECFGLLGVNGAGKTTTFKMLTGDCLPNAGNAMMKGYSLRSNLKKFQSNLGYCPQFDALIDRLTGREMLRLFGRLRGLKGSELDDQVEKLIKMTDLTAHADKQTQFYSGGNKRKLSVGITLIGFPPVILLDEPTAGVDPVSRRKIWKILTQARNITGAAIILTTHSMEESEALCSRLAIMVNGRFRCLGSIQELKSKYGQGYTLVVKVKREVQEDMVTVEAIQSHIKNHLSGAILKDYHQGMLQYHVVDPSVSLSYLFKFMAEVKSQFDLEDYLISDTSLEQIFLTFARAQRVSD